MTSTRRSAPIPSRSGQPRLRCAIYTRKSTEEGLDQEFNSLDAQREACAAFVTSQVGLGWKLIADRYDDGGISGGTLERPALQRLLQDIKDRKVDVVVVYKIDRLTRSLADFAKIVEVFDGHSVSFVSVTQQFNTTTSMGRLTLNVLLSFAQFEREVTAERIRDKIAASRKKGMWMGGTVPFGYQLVGRKLMVDEAAAAEVRELFDLYLKLKSVPALAAKLNRRLDDNGQIRSLLSSYTGQGRRKPPRTVRVGKLYYMLANPIYVGKVKHNGQVHEGEQPPIISQQIYDQAQAMLAQGAPVARGSSVHRDLHLLNGLLFDERGDRVSPKRGQKAGKRYRYYISNRLNHGLSKPFNGWRLPAQQIERIVFSQLQTVLSDKALLSRWCADLGQGGAVEEVFAAAESMHVELDSELALDRVRAIIHTVIRRIDLADGCIRITIDRQRLLADLCGRHPIADGDGALPHVIDVPIIIRKRGVERRLVIEGSTTTQRYLDQPLIDAMARAHAYVDALTSGLSRNDVAQKYQVHPEDVSRALPLAYLAPDIAGAILTGTQPAELAVRDLTPRMDLPMEWQMQREALPA